jgi:hypothetical protein
MEVERALRVTCGIFVVALAVHGVDHLRRGTEAVSDHVSWAGNVQLGLALGAAVLVFTGHRLGAPAAAVVGLASAVGFAAVHLVPHWSAFSDAFWGDRVGPGVNGFSWFAALLEIAAGAALGLAGLAAMGRRAGTGAPVAGQAAGTPA